MPYSLGDYRPIIDAMLAPLPDGKRVDLSGLLEGAFGEFEGDLEDVFTEVIHGCLTSLDTRGPWWLLMQVDWRAWDEVEWQAQLMARTVGIDDTFHVDFSDVDPSDRIVEAFSQYQQWLNPRGFSYIQWDEGDDCYRGFAIPTASADEFIRQASNVGIDMKLAESFG